MHPPLRLTVRPLSTEEGMCTEVGWPMSAIGYKLEDSTACSQACGDVNESLMADAEGVRT